MTETLKPRDRAEEEALFRAQLVGALAALEQQRRRWQRVRKTKARASHARSC